MNAPPCLATARLRMRPTRLEDAEALHLGYADAEAMRWGAHAPHTTIEQTRAKVARNLANTEWRGWTITLAGDDVAIGTLAVHETRERVAEIGYSLLRSHWGAGLAREAVAGLLDQLFREEGYRRVYADIDPDNLASRRLVEALAFRLEGTLRAEWETHLGVRDALIYGLLADEWRASS